jgi:hypothetical protein
MAWQVPQKLALDVTSIPVSTTAQAKIPRRRIAVTPPIQKSAFFLAFIVFSFREISYPGIMMMTAGALRYAA